MFPVLAGLCVRREIIITYNNKDKKSTSGSVRFARSDRNAYCEKLD